MNILIVDNSPDFIRFMKNLLQQDGHNVRDSEDIFSCIDCLLGFTPDVIFIDLVMSSISGDVLCQIIRSKEQFAHCYIVIMSAIAAEYSRDYATSGANECIAKGPFQETARLVRAAIRNSQNATHSDNHSFPQGIEILHPREVTKELLNINRHFFHALQNISQAVIELKNDRIAYANPFAEKIWEIPKEKFIGAHIDEIFPPELKAQIELKISDSKKGTTSPAKKLIRLLDRYVSVETLVCNDNGNIIILLYDMTEQSLMESAMSAANQSENLGFIFSGIRHEIGNPLNSIKMALSVLQKNTHSFNRELIADFVNRSLEEVCRIEYLLKALKTYSLFESPNISSVSIDFFFEHFVALVQTELQKKNIQLHVFILKNGLKVKADITALHHIMLNLITNAAEAVENREEPRIVITVSHEQDESIIIRVDDNGKGMTELEKSNLFKPFFTSKAKGTGLGLVNVRKMLESMDGKMDVHSYRSIGTTIILTLPGDVDDKS